MIFDVILYLVIKKMLAKAKETLMVICGTIFILPIYLFLTLTGFIRDKMKKIKAIIMDIINIPRNIKTKVFSRGELSDEEIEEKRKLCSKNCSDQFDEIW